MFNTEHTKKLTLHDFICAYNSDFPLYIDLTLETNLGNFPFTIEIGKFKIETPTSKMINFNMDKLNLIDAKFIDEHKVLVTHFHPISNNKIDVTVKNKPDTMNDSNIVYRGGNN